MTVPANFVSANGVGAVSDDNLNTLVQVCNNVAAARAFVGITNMTIQLLGTTAPGDGGVGTFYWSATSTAEDDDGATVIRPNGVTVGAWLRDIPPAGAQQKAILVENGVTAAERISDMPAVANPPPGDVLVPLIVAGQTINFSSSISTLLTAPTQTITNGPGNPIIISGGDANGTGMGGPVVLQGGDGGASGGGASVVLVAGNAGTLGGVGGDLVANGGTGYGTLDGGAVAVTAGPAVGTGHGGTMVFAAGNGVGGGGALVFSTGTSNASGNGGALVVSVGGGGATGGSGGPVQVIAGSAQTGNFAGGTVTFTAGNSTGNAGGGAWNLTAGNALGTGAGGAVVLTGGTAAGTAGAGGPITLAAGAGAGTSNGGDIFIAPGAAGGGGSNRRGLIFAQNVATADPSVSQAVWASHGYLVLSGVASATNPLLQTVPFSFVGLLPNGQTYNIPLTQAGTLLANGGTLASYIPVNPTATQHLTLNTIHSGTITPQCTITISTGGAVSGVTFSAVAFAAGDVVQIANQATADTTFANAAFGFQFLKS